MKRAPTAVPPPNPAGRNGVLRRGTMAALAALILTGGVVAGAGPASAVTEAAPGAPCDSSDLGRRQGWANSMEITPAITHFKGFFVTAGSTGTHVVQMTYQQQLTVQVMNDTSVSTGFNFGIPFLTKLEVSARFQLTKTTMTTTTEQRTLTWNFTQPGYYAVYSGMHKVSGQMSALQCHRVQKEDGRWVTEWNRRATGTYTTWGREQEGVVRCEDTVPANSIMRTAQIELGCAGPAAQRAARAARDADDGRRATPAAVGPTAAAIPTGYACDPGYHYLISGNGMYLTQDDSPYMFWWTSPVRTSSHWRVCHGPVDATGMPPSVLIGRWNGACVGAGAGATAVEGAAIDWSSCEAVPLRQKLYIYRDVPGSDLVGIQLAYRGGMFSQDELVSGSRLQQSEGGKPDGSGTYRLVPA
ncbi:hypothetical protein [Jidongwangia harbinensis]|uniref:hypothetical protein n=1 Tax=Jidongwangia harbinensis TaxID=2878561 RepID=UPI001CD9C1FC|nr:hypothetical protein [Jidongwangia harbinensis]MCA2219102.1 hypothetical protein [Jidongwangia harbinensis]